MAQDPRVRLKAEREIMARVDQQLAQLSEQRAGLLLTDVAKVEKVDGEIRRLTRARGIHAEVIDVLTIEAAKLEEREQEQARAKAVTEVIAPAVAVIVEDAAELQAALLVACEVYGRLQGRCAAIRRDRPAAVPAPRFTSIDLGSTMESVFHRYSGHSADSFIASLAHNAKKLHSEVAKRADAYLVECRSGMTVSEFRERVALAPFPGERGPVVDEEAAA
jgi:hypothetical protein